MKRISFQFLLPSALAPKKDGCLRFCVDYSKLNAAILRVSYPTPQMIEYTDFFKKAKVILTLDAKAGYW